MEAKVEPLLMPMIQGRPAIRTAEEANLIATWATKVAVLWEYLDPPELRIFPTHTASTCVRKVNLPPKRSCLQVPYFRTWCGRITRHTSCLLWGTKQSPTSTQAWEQTASYRCSAFVGCFLLFAGLWTDWKPPYDPSPSFSESLVRLYPDPPQYLTWPKSQPLNDELVTKIAFDSSSLFFLPPPDAKLPTLEEFDVMDLRPRAERRARKGRRDQ